MVLARELTKAVPSFFLKACDAGDRDACAYRDKIQTSTTPCSEDPFLCGWHAMRTNDLALNDDACSHGVGDGCTIASSLVDRANDPAKSQLYLEKGCQLGSPLACQGLAERLSPDCEPHKLYGGDGSESWSTCFAIDEPLAKQAREIGCEAGWGKGCRYEPR